jgi:hypothetical protein
MRMYLGFTFDDVALSKYSGIMFSISLCDHFSEDPLAMFLPAMQKSFRLMLSFAYTLIKYDCPKNTLK